MRSAKRVLLSEGSSLSARQSVTALGIAGHQIGVCDPNPACLGRFSRFVTRYYRCPAVGKDPWAYLDFVLGLLCNNTWDVLFPTHEQAFLFSRERARIPSGIGVAVADFRSFLQIQGKAALVKTLERISIPQPASRVIRTREELLSERRFPFYLKADYATASTAVWRIRSVEELKSTASVLVSEGRMDCQQDFVVQELAEGSLERVQAVFDRGRLVAIHGYRQMVQGLGGGDISKLSVRRPAVRSYVQLLGEQLQWHGALSLDYILLEEEERPLFIDANPRLVEPMNGVFAGVNLADLQVRVSTGEAIATMEPDAKELRTHMLMMGLLSAASARGRRLDVVVELMRALARCGLYAGSQEELLPVRIDFKSVVPLAYVLGRVLLNPRSATALTVSSISSYSLSSSAARQIADLSVGKHPP
jgi:sorbitol-specific phosphotransferase system component IIC